MASPLEAIATLLKADISLVVTDGTVKLRVSGSILKIPDHPVENPANPMPEVMLLQSMSFIPILEDSSFLKNIFLSFLIAEIPRAKIFSVRSFRQIEAESHFYT